MTKTLKHRGWYCYLSHICRILFAATFIVSGFLKAIDPWGTILSMRNYLVAYDVTMPEWLVTSFSICLGGFELLLGCMLLLKLAVRFASVASMVLMPIFTIVTLLSATVVPIEDCGCFGELIKLTPWQSFAKNVALLLMAICFWGYHRKDAFAFSKKEVVVTSILMVVTLGLGIYSYRHLPLIDTLPYKKGVNIAEEMSNARSEHNAERVVLLYRNNVTNEVHEFSVEDTAWQNDSLWSWVDTRVEKIQKGAEPTLLEFYVSDGEGDKTIEVLSVPKIYLLFMAQNELSDDVRERFEMVERYVEKRGVALAYVSPQDISNITLVYPILNMDPKTMKTILRADYGLVVLEKGVVVDKCNFRDINF